MFRGALVKAAIEEGSALIAELRKLRLHVKTAIWHLDRHGIWRLTLNIPEVASRGPIYVNRQLDKAFARIQPKHLNIDFISAMSPSGGFEELENDARTGGITGLGFTSGPPKDIVYSDAYIYRLRSPNLRSPSQTR